MPDTIPVPREVLESMRKDVATIQILIDTEWHPDWVATASRLCASIDALLAAPAVAPVVPPTSTAAQVWALLDDTAKQVHNETARDDIREFLARAWHHVVLPALAATAPPVSPPVPTDTQMLDWLEDAFGSHLVDEEKTTLREAIHSKLTDSAWPWPEVSAQGVQRFSMGFFRGAPAMFGQPDGSYVRWADYCKAVPINLEALKDKVLALPNWYTGMRPSEQFAFNKAIGDVVALIEKENTK